MSNACFIPFSDRHPDKNKDENAEAKFVEINRAYEVIIKTMKLIEELLQSLITLTT